jgi:membrane protease YdiL (CAAX protease family)
MPSGEQQPPRLPPGGPSQRLARVDAADLLLLFIIGLAAMRFLGPVFFSLFADTRTAAEQPSPPVTMAFIAFHSIILLAVLNLLILKRHHLSWRDLGLGPLDGRLIRRGIFGGFLCLPLVAITNLFVQSTKPEPLENPQIEALMGSGGVDPWMLIVLIPVGGMLVPFVEELLFRGLLFRWLGTRMKIPWAVTISSLVFALLHGIPHFIPAITVLGAVLALLVQRSQSLWPAIVAHGTFNSVMIVMIYSLLSAGVEMPA